jgi:hypothetical protein
MLKRKATHLFLIQTSAGKQQYATAEPVLKLGAAADCGIRISGLPPHAVTLVLEPNAVRVMNRSTLPVLVGSNNIGNGGNARLKSGGCLQVGKISITWRPHDAKAQATPAAPVKEKPAKKETAGKEPRKRNKDLVNYAILALCVIVLGYWHLNGQENTYETSQPDFEYLVSQLRTDGTPTEQFLRELLQQARTNERRDVSRAVNDYLHVQRISERLRIETEPEPGGVDLGAAAKMFAEMRTQALAG